MDDLRQLVESCSLKRRLLLVVAHRATKWRKFLNVSAGVLALCSAASMTTIVAELTSSLGVKIFSAAVAFLSGVITLFATSFFDESDVQKAHDGAAKFMALRDKAHLAVGRPDATEKQAFAELSNLVSAYNNLSAEYDRLLPQNFLRGRGQAHSHFHAGALGWEGAVEAERMQRQQAEWDRAQQKR
jgi:hypothetical protein